MDIRCPERKGGRSVHKGSSQVLDHITPMNVRAKMESLTAKLDELSESISAMRCCVEGAAGTDMEGIHRVSLARLLWEAESIIEMMDDPGQPMPWWREWQSALAKRGAASGA